MVINRSGDSSIEHTCTSPSREMASNMSTCSGLAAEYGDSGSKGRASSPYRFLQRSRSCIAACCCRIVQVRPDDMTMAATGMSAGSSNCNGQRRSGLRISGRGRDAPSARQVSAVQEKEVPVTRHPPRELLRRALLLAAA